MSLYIIQNKIIFQVANELTNKFMDAIIETYKIVFSGGWFSAWIGLTIAIIIYGLVGDSKYALIKGIILFILSPLLYLFISLLR